MANSITVEFPTGELHQFLAEYTDLIDKAKASALRRSASVLKKAAKSAITSAGFAYNTNNSHPRKIQYNDTLQDGIRITGIRDYGDEIGIHVLGTQAKGSGTFRLRFFELGTKERIAKTYNGQPLKKQRKLGKIDASKFAFFNSAVQGATSEAQSAFIDQFNKYIDSNWN